MQQSERHLNQWDIRTERSYSPAVYTLGGARYDEPLTPVTVQISAAFDNNDAALDFERQVRELLEKL